MAPRHFALGIAVALIWGVNFLAIDIALEGFPPLLLTALRFALAALPAILLPRPPLPWRRLIVLAAFMFAGPYSLLFVAMSRGMPPGLASVVLEAQAVLTILLGAAIIGEHPGAREKTGIGLAIAGLFAIGTTVGEDVTLLGFGLTLAAAGSFAFGNILTRRLPGGNPLALVVWMSLVTLPPMLVISLLIEGPETILLALETAGPRAILALLFTAGISTLVAFGLWGFLLHHHPVAKVMPFALLVPVIGVIASVIVTGEALPAPRLGGAALILAGMAIILPALRSAKASQ